MDQKELGDSIAKQLDAAADTIYWALLLAIVFLWAGLTNQDPIKALGMEIARSYALFIACGLYLATNLFVMVLFLRVGDTLQLVDDLTLPLALTKLGTHKWVANPFAFFGNGQLAKIYSSGGFGLLIIVWWIGNTSLYALSNDAFSPIGLLLQGLFLAIGLASMTAVQRVLFIVMKRVELISPELHAEIGATIPYRAFLTFVGIGTGGMIAFANNMGKLLM
ncbi:hypothetical protein [Bradyrhizobium sp. JYMT SZCCT0180]|uniref:hypothetical protein n=1 Tax=Bradyrhizobium sp. JYMT SZCCT0180 TaxID=2807666 RepID=UPI001BABF75A|nr:hypothetical protein [Bradyrhizobium sp. JYMT SZCCT0180]MBR1210315.1 hypothetical protein [Bradyrhizobium sp. JYMT SZCCT0180]